MNWRSYRGDSQSDSIRGGLENLSESACGAKVFSVDRKIYPALLQHPNRQQDAQCSDSAPKRLKGSLAKRGSTGFQASPLMMSRCSTCQNESLKEPSENAEYPWRAPIPKEELEAESAPIPVGPIGPWQSAMITKYDLMQIEFASDGTSWTIIQQSKHYSVSRMLATERAVHDHRDRREVIKVSREVTEARLSDMLGASTSRDGTVEAAQTNASTCQETVD